MKVLCAFAVVLGLGVGLANAETTNTASVAGAGDSVAATAIQGTDTLPALEKQERDLMAQAGDVMRQIAAAHGPLWAAKRRAKERDPELLAIEKQIAALDHQRETKLLEKYPDIAKLQQESDVLVKHSSELNEQLRDVRRKMDALKAKGDPTGPETRQGEQSGQGDKK